MSSELREYLEFKMEQYARLHNFDYTSDDAKDRLKKIMKANMQDWIREAIHAGC